MSNVSTTFYVQIQPEFYSNGKVSRLKAVGMTQRHPLTQKPGTALLKLRVELDETAFALLEAVVTVPPRHLSIVTASTEPAEGEQ